MTANDHRLVHELMTVSLEGYRFYETVARKANSSEIRLLFREMALVKADIAQDLSQYVSNKEMDQISQSELAATLSAIYRLLNRRCIDASSSHCLAELAVTERHSLEIFKINVRRMSDKNMASYLAGHLANIQLSQDRMKQLTPAWRTV